MVNLPVERAAEPLAADEPVAAAPRTLPLALSDLLNTFDCIVELLEAALRRADVLNAFLLAAGLNQIAEDHLHADPWHLGRAASHMENVGGSAGRLGAQLARRTAVQVSAIREPRRPNRRVANWQGELAGLVHALGRQVAGPPSEAVFDNVRESLRVLLGRVGGLPPAMRSTILRLPSCFRSFDQRPEDASALARLVSRIAPDGQQALVVVGVRTSGSYLAPLCGAALEAEGHCDVSVFTVRPGHPFLASELSRLRALVGRGALVLLVDDPPTTGETLDRAASQLVDSGVPCERLAFMLALAGPMSSLPAKLADRKGVYLPLSEWSVQDRLLPEAVIESFAAMVAPASDVVGLQRLPDPEPLPTRGHVRGLYQVRLADAVTGRQRDEQLLVKGAGLGYFGDHALAVDSALRRYLPKMHGVRDSLVYRQWLPAGSRLRLADNRLDDLAREMAGYVHTRHQALPAGADASMRVFGRGAAWEVGANLFSRAFGRGWFVARVPLVDPVVRRILAVDQPSVIDGSTRSSHWFADEGNGGRLCKVDADERAFTHTDLYCYDPVFDLAGLVAEGDGPCVADRARAAYEELSGEHVSDERWLVHTLIHIWDRRRSDTADRTCTDRASARAVQKYLARLYLADLSVPRAGSLCAIDIDGVLETDVLGFPASSPLGASSLRALTAHGYRPVLVTGRSLADVRDRCETYRLAGGVAEYGSVVYDHVRQSTRALVPDAAAASLVALRHALAEEPGVIVDADYQFSVRASTVDGAGRRRSLDPAVVDRLLVRLGRPGLVGVVAGESQTDFVAAGVDKGRGLVALADELGGAPRASSGAVAAMAIGDTASDLPMLARASLALAPGNADAAVRRSGVEVLRRQYQAGLGEATRRLLHHQPGRCPRCRPPSFSTQTRMLLAVLAAREDGMRGLPGRGARLGLGLAGLARW